MTFVSILIICSKFQIKDEILSSYQQIKTLCSQIRQSRTRRNSNESIETSSSSEEILHPDSLTAGALNSALHELRGLVHDMLRKESKGIHNDLLGTLRQNVLKSLRSQESKSAFKKFNFRRYFLFYYLLNIFCLRGHFVFVTLSSFRPTIV